jgi:flagella basal body P-ring formation protein FlgA
VVRAKGKLSRGEVISKDQVSVTLEPLDYRNEKAFSKIEEVEGKEVKREIPAGAVLTSSFLQKKRLLSEEELVTMVAKYGGILVTVTEKHEEDVVWEIIIVVDNPDSKKR